MKFYKRTITIFLATLLTMMSVLQVCANNSNDVKSAEEQLYEMISFEGDFEVIDFSPELQSGARSLTEIQSITIPWVGMSSFIRFDIDAYGIDEENYDDFVCDDVEYTSSNEEVAFVYDGRILARGVGNALVTIEYGGMIQNIAVTVENEVPEKIMRNLESEGMAYARSTEQTERLNIAQKAIDMVYCHWTPTSDVIGWNNEHTFKANKMQTGVPYSQVYNKQCDDVAFLAAMSNSDFYTSYYNGSDVVMPMYGNDCSAFVAICWGGLLYNGVDRYNTKKFYDNYASIGSYANLQKGDAVVKYGHMFLITQNHVDPPEGTYSESYVVCYEQTPCNAILSFWTYSQLELYGYKPISKF